MAKPFRRPTFSLPSFLTGFVVFIIVLFTFATINWASTSSGLAVPRFGWLFTDTTTAGGDMGSHVWLPQFIRDHVLPHGRISGWAPDWYNGFPALQFYFPVPAVMVIILDVFLPYNIAFKLVTVSGLLALPICAWAFGRLARLPFPVPACLAAATLPFLFDTGFTIFGGNIASTLAGEYAFSISLAFSFLFLGLVANGLQTGRRRALAGVLFALVVMSHVLPTIFAITGGVVLFLMRMVTGRQDAERSMTAEGMSEPYGSEDDAAVASGADLVGVDAVPATASATSDVAVEVEPEAPREPGWKNRLAAFNWGAPVLIAGSLLSCIWLIPFVMRMEYMNDMGWEKIEPQTNAEGNLVASAVKLYDQDIFTYWDALFPNKLTPVIILAFCGVLLTIVLAVTGAIMRAGKNDDGRYYTRRISVFFAILALIWAVAFVVMPQGRLWNARFLPFWYLSLYMLAAMFIAEIGWGLADLVRSVGGRVRSTYSDIAEGMALITPIVVLLFAFGTINNKLPAPDWFNMTVGPFQTVDESEPTSFIPGWAEWNYSGYQRKDAYPEYQQLISTMDQIGKTNGCGRAMWEYESELNRFGTPMALMLMPTFTNGCIGSEEGLFFESSPTVAFHFLNQSEMSAVPSRAMRGMPYQDLNVSAGIDKMQIMGVKYYMAFSSSAQTEASQDSRLTLLSSIPAAADANGTERTWNVYEIADTELVQSVTNLPAVITDPASKSPETSDSRTTPVTNPDGTTAEQEEVVRTDHELWLDNMTKWYQTPSDHDVYLSEDGPSDWPRVANSDAALPRVPVDPVNVSTIITGDDRIEFDVDRVGVPVVVKASYFPNWIVEGADKVYRVGPNQMVVIPTSNHVSLYYGRTPVDWLGVGLTVGGFVLVGWLVWRERRRDEDGSETDFTDLIAKPFRARVKRKNANPLVESGRTE